VTEEECVPVLARVSGLRCGTDFTVGYSPERINPGDKEHTFTKITKVVSGQDAATLEIVASVYESVVTAGVHRASSIRVAEAAKVIENTQRDLNIALMNELSLIFDRMGIDTNDVLAAAGTKWNFLTFTPGLVGGHCIGVDPYYLTHKAEKMGYIPQVILAGRRINDGMGAFIAQRTIREMIHAGHCVLGSMVTVLGLTFKEDCPDLRNSKVIDIIRELQDYGITVQVSDPLADPDEALHEYGVLLAPLQDLSPAAVVIVAVAHKEFREMNVGQLHKLMGVDPTLIDVKCIYDRQVVIDAGIRLWRL
jgi:UDP-N-acetyl-D-galactosamine dehydrogenase